MVMRRIFGYPIHFSSPRLPLLVGIGMVRGFFVVFCFWSCALASQAILSAIAFLCVGEERLLSSIARVAALLGPPWLPNGWDPPPVVVWSLKEALEDELFERRAEGVVMLGDNVFSDPAEFSSVLEDLSLEVDDFLDAILIRPLFQLKVVEGTTSKPFDVALGAISNPSIKENASLRDKLGSAPSTSQWAVEYFDKEKELIKVTNEKDSLEEGGREVLEEGGSIDCKIGSCRV
ncbi:hypothetical protein SUGI_1040830 [Cryptomeria japonica]|nr:hypothetical protein SUGI_1040830 [Cryptomeria japonica]